MWNSSLKLIEIYIKDQYKIPHWIKKISTQTSNCAFEVGVGLLIIVTELAIYYNRHKHCILNEYLDWGSR